MFYTPMAISNHYNNVRNEVYFELDLGVFGEKAILADISFLANSCKTGGMENKLYIIVLKVFS